MWVGRSRLTGEAATGSRISHVNTQANGAHDGHGDEVQDGGFEPLPESRPGVP